MITALLLALAVSPSPAPSAVEVTCVPWLDSSAVCRVGPPGTSAIIHVPAESIRLSAEESTIRVLTRLHKIRSDNAKNARPSYRQVGEPEPRRPLKRWEKILRGLAYVSVPVIVTVAYTRN